MTKSFSVSLIFQFLLVPFAFGEGLLIDPGFLNGYQVISPQRDIYTGQPKVDSIHGSDPAWRLMQWGNIRSLAEATLSPTSRGGKQWILPVGDKEQGGSFKRVALEPGGEVVLELNALARFTELHYQKLDGEDLYLDTLEQYWPHLLMAQPLNTRNLSDYRALRLSLDAKLLFDQPNHNEGYNPAIHAARFPVVIGVRNTLSNQMFWLSLVIYDDRYREIGFNCQKCTAQEGNKEQCHTPHSLAEPGHWKCPFDGVRWRRDVEKSGTGKMIFRIPTTAAQQTSIQPSEWQHYEVDLIPYLRAGIDAARDSVNPKGFSPDLRFYRLSHFSFGWEITGLNHAAMAVKNLSLNGE